MANDDDIHCAKIFIYFVALVNFAGGVYAIYSSFTPHPALVNSSGWSIATGVIALLIGLILVLGTATENAKCILAVLLVSVPISIAGTIQTIINLVEIQATPREAIPYIVMYTVRWLVLFWMYKSYRILVDARKSRECLLNGQTAEVIEEPTINTTNVLSVSLGYNRRQQFLCIPEVIGEPTIKTVI